MKKLTLDLIFRVVGILAKLGIVVLLERSLSADEFAQYAIFLALIALGSNIFRFGSDNLLFRISTSGSLLDLSQGLSRVVDLYKHSLLLKVTIAFFASYFLSVIEVCILIVGIESLSLLHYYCLVIRARGQISTSIFIFEVAPNVLLIFSILLASPVAGQEAILMQYMIILLISSVCFIKERKLISYFLRRRQGVTKKPFKPYLKEISFFGFANFSNSFTSWGDVLLIGLLFDPVLTTAYFLLTRVFSGCERIAIIPLYPVYNFLGREFQRDGYILRSKILKIVPAFMGYSVILLFGSIGLVAVLSVSSFDIFEGLGVISLSAQVALLLSLFIVSTGTVIEHMSFIID